MRRTCRGGVVFVLCGIFGSLWVSTLAEARVVSANGFSCRESVSHSVTCEGAFEASVGKSHVAASGNRFVTLSLRDRAADTESSALVEFSYASGTGCVLMRTCSDLPCTGYTQALVIDVRGERHALLGAPTAWDEESLRYCPRMMDGRP